MENNSNILVSGSNVEGEGFKKGGIAATIG
jgi:hypothetical protein